MGSRGESPVAIYAYEVPSSTGWAGPSPAMAFLPTHFVSIGAMLERKIEAMEQYQSERRAWPHPYFDRATGEPKFSVTVLSRAEREAARRSCGPR